MHSSIQSSDIPVYRLSDDDLEQVFATYLAKCSGGSGYSFPPAFRHILLLTRVCKRWREVAIHFPSLWSWFLIPTSHPKDSLESLLRLFLLRAKNHPLTFKILRTVRRRADSLDPMNSALQILLERRKFWRDADLSLAHYPSAFDDIPYGDFSRLESVLLEEDGMLTSQQRSYVWRLFVTSPAIQKVSLRRFCDSVPYFETTPWHQLRSLDISEFYITPGVLLDILKSSVALERFHFSYMVDHRRPFRPSTPVKALSPIILPNLQQMHLMLYEPHPYQGAERDIYEWFLGSISAPNLTWLELWLYHEPPSLPFINFCKYSGARLQHFRIYYDGKFHDDKAIEWLELPQ